jgi:3,4-dihydroxy 2-butanone 4-phosphate synthase / GTP cyclohydrolase II
MFDPIEEIIAEIKAGRMVIIADDEDRENEGDLIMSAEMVSPEAIRFIVRYTSGVICVPMEGVDLDRLELPLMTAQNTERMRTAYTVSVDAADGVTTGISAADRSRTIQLLSNANTQARDLVRPGHVFPLRYREGGVLRRAGHTEASVDLARLAGLRPAGVLAEIVNEDGSMARLPQLLEFKEKHSLKIGSIADLIAYRRQREKLVERLETVRLPTEYGEFQMHLYRSKLDGGNHVALVRGELCADKPSLVRVHSECLTGDVFASRRCDCGNQLHAALRQIGESGCGVLVYLRQEGRGIGLAAKIHAYKLQEEGLDTVEANERLGFPADLRDYGLGAQILLDLGVKEFRFLTNNPRKVVGLESYGLKMIERVPIQFSPNPDNADYLRAKKFKMGHML